MNILNDRTFILNRIKQLCPAAKIERFTDHFRFLAGGKWPLVISRELSSVSSLKFSLDEANCLHLSDVRLYSKGEDVTPQAARLTLSSCYKELEYSWGKPVGDKYFFHTEREKNPWATLQFPELVAIDTIMIFNRKDSCCARAATVSIFYASEADANPEWIELFNLKKNRKEFYTLFPVPSMQYKIKNEEINLLDTLIISFFLEDEYTIKRLYARIENYTSQEKLLCLLSQEILYPLKKEYSAHGIRNTFRFWSEDKKKQYIEDSLLLIYLLKNISPDVSFMYGTVLGFVREIDCFIPYDDDIDISIFLPEQKYTQVSSAVSYLEEQLDEMINRYKVQHIFSVTKRFSTHLHIRSTRSYKIDVFVGLYTPSGEIIMAPIKRGYYMHKKYIFPTVDLDIMSYPCPVPNNVVSYLDITYGKDWRIPQNKPNASHGGEC